MTQPGEKPAIQRVRLVYARREALRYISHLDMQMVWERTLRRAGVPLAYSKGFHPTPRLHMAAALPLGFLSQCEITDIWLESAGGAGLDAPDNLVAKIRAAAPPGLEIRQGESVPLHLPALQTLVQSARYSATPLDPPDWTGLEQAVGLVLGAVHLPRVRRGKAYDLRPLIQQLSLAQDSWQGCSIQMQLAASEGATGRPEEVLAAMDQDPAGFRIERTALILRPLAD